MLNNGTKEATKSLATCILVLRKLIESTKLFASSSVTSMNNNQTIFVREPEKFNGAWSNMAMLDFCTTETEQQASST